MAEGSVAVFGQPVVCPIMVGREDARDALCGLVDRIAVSGGGVGLIAGEAGVGKSRLLASTREYAGSHRFRILVGACFPQDRVCPYAPLVDLMRAAIAGRPHEAVAQGLGAFASELLPLLPELTGQVSHTPPAALDLEHARRRLFAAMAHTLAWQGEGRPTLLLVEDLHWCDDGSLDFLLHLARLAVDQRMLLLGTYRREDVESSLQHWLAQLDREHLVAEFGLPPLTREQVGAMLAAIFGEVDASPADLLDPIYAMAEGNPFYVEELLKSLVEAGDLAYSEGGWTWGSSDTLDQRIPRSLHDVVAQRVAGISPATRHVLTLAAVVGRRFDFNLLQGLVGVDEATLLTQMKELVAAQLVVEESRAVFAFRHALIRRAIYTDLLSLERVALHRSVGETAEQFYADAPERHLDTFAHHFYRAEVWNKALEYCRGAGERAQRLYAPRAAIGHLNRALEAAGHLELCGAVGAASLAEMHRRRGGAHERVGEFEAARQDYETAVDLATRADDRLLELQALLDLGTLWTGRDYEQAGPRFTRALDLARALGDRATVARALNRLGNWQVNVAQPREALELHREALAIFEALQDRRGIAETLDLLGTASFLSADLPGSMAYFERAVALFRELDDRPGLVSSLAMLCVRGGCYELGSMTSTSADIEMGILDGTRAIELAREIDWRSGEAFAQSQLAVVLGLRGDYGDALAMGERSLRIAEEIEHRQWMAGAHCALGQVYLDMLILPSARQHLEKGLALARETRSGFWIQLATGCLAWAYVLGGELGKATGVLGPRPGGADPVRSLGERWITFGHMQLSLARRDAEQAMRSIGRLNAPPLEGGSPQDTPRPALARSEAYMLLGEFEKAEATLLKVIPNLRRQGARPMLWRSQMALATAYRALKRTEDAQREYSASRTTIEDLAGEFPEGELRDQFLRAATARLPRPYRLSQRRVESARFGGLTAREREVAAMVAAGRSNREIAEALVLGERTVETHVSNVLAKLGLGSRREIARWARDKGLSDLAI